MNFYYILLLMTALTPLLAGCNSTNSHTNNRINHNLLNSEQCTPSDKINNKEVNLKVTDYNCLNLSTCTLVNKYTNALGDKCRTLRSHNNENKLVIFCYEKTTTSNNNTHEPNNNNICSWQKIKVF